MAMSFKESTLASSNATDTLATYRWVPENPKAAVFLVHGFRSHARFNFLRQDSPTDLHIYGQGTTSVDTSLVRELNLRDFAVFAHDHVGHGNSTGLRAYFPSFALLVQDLLKYVRNVDEELSLTEKGIPIFLVGHSLGGTASIVASRDNPSLFAGIALSSAATEPPASMFGLMGHIQRALSGITSTIVPKAQLLSIPKSEDHVLQELYEADPLNSLNGIRARVGREFLNAYQDISDRLPEITVPFLAAFGENDTFVNPLAAKRFCDGASSTDKTLYKVEGRWHNVLVEKGKEELWTLFADWIANRVKS